ncbi:MAG: DUF2800 domain-containing protein [Armatimonadota bacterium]|nr:DUF2800 domain-containing protein [Armatimonadota bacterium]
MRLHYELGPSGAHRWMNCPGSVAAERDAPKPVTGNAYTREGTAAHEVLAKAFSVGRVSHSPGDTVLVWDGDDYCTVEVTQEMVDGAGLFLRALGPQRPGEIRFVERTLDLSIMRPPVPMGGTPDLVVVRGSRISIWDYKFGRGVRVRPENNPQLMYYALLAWSLILRRRVPARRIRGPVELVIVQPRLPDPVRRAYVSISELRAFRAALFRAARAALRPGAPRVAGEWCRWCRAQDSCPAFRERVSVVAAEEFSVEGLDPAGVARTLGMAEAIRSWLAGVERAAREMALRGVAIPGYKLVLGRKHRRWRDPAAAEAACRARGLHPVQYLSLRTPAQVEAQWLAQGLPVEELAQHWEHPIGDPVLVPEDHPGAEYRGVVSEFGLTAPPSSSE